MTQIYRILDAVSGAVISTQIWDDPQAPVVRNGQIAVPVNTSVASASGTFSATGAGSALELIGNFNLSVWGAFTGSLALEKSFDGGTTYIPASFADGTVPRFSAATSCTWAECEKGVLYRPRCVSFVTGPINWRLSR